TTASSRSADGIPTRGRAARAACISSSSTGSGLGGAASAAHAASNAPTSRRDEQSAARNASRAADGGTAPSARWAASTSPTPTVACAARIRSASSDTNRSGTGEDPLRTDAVDVLAYLQRRTERRVEVTDGLQCARPCQRLADAGKLVAVAVAQPRHGFAHSPRSVLGDARQPRAHDLDLALDRRVLDPVVQAAALERVVQLADAVGRQDDERSPRGDHRPELRDRHLEVREQLKQERLELVIGAVDLVDEQDHRLGRLERLEKRAAQKEAPRVQLVGSLAAAEREELARVVPVVEGVVDVDALVALQPDQPCPERAGQSTGDLGLADARLALEQQRLFERRRQEHRRRQAAIGQVALAGEPRLDLLDAPETHPAACSSARRQSTRARWRL